MYGTLNVFIFQNFVVGVELTNDGDLQVHTLLLRLLKNYINLLTLYT